VQSTAAAAPQHSRSDFCSSSAAVQLAQELHSRVLAAIPLAQLAQLLLVQGAGEGGAAAASPSAVAAVQCDLLPPAAETTGGQHSASRAARSRPGPSCANCGAGKAQVGQLMLCGGCMATRYCGGACQAAHWRAHKAECQEAVGVAAAGNVAREGELEGQE
jgi:hypothetical protein